MNFTWIEFYQEFANKLVEYKDNRKKLISIVLKAYEIAEQNMPKMDVDNNLVDIDPFTVFGTFNKGLTDANRIKLIKAYAGLLGIEKEIPDVFDGIPILNAMKATYYSFGDDRGKDDIENLWKVFLCAINYAENKTGENRKAFIEAYDIVLNQKCIKWNITMGLYWIRPYVYINLDSRNRWFITNADFMPKEYIDNNPKFNLVPTGDIYMDLCDRTMKLIENNEDYKTFPELSYSAWLKTKDDVLLNQDSALYTIEQIREALRNVGIEGKDIASNMVQIGPKSTTICVTKGNGIILYATDSDFKNISEAKNLKNNATVYSPKSVEIMQDIINKESGREDAVLCFEQGNKLLHPGQAANYNPHEVRIYSNECFNKVFKILTGQVMKSSRGINKENIERRQSMNSQIKEEFDKNLILYGPPGTGKTYNTAIIAVKICDPSFDTSDYSAVMDKYNQLKTQGRIAFTTFHQSYGYEEFIEGIKPVVDADSENIGYTIESGSFKRFCEKARTPKGIDVAPNASIWFMRLENDKEPGKKKECFENGIIYQSDVEEWEKDRFVSKMQVGDYIISYAGRSECIDAVGVIESEAENGVKESTWTRKIVWTLFEESINVREINGGKYLPNFSCVKMNNMKLSDLLRLFPKNNSIDEFNLEPYVFIIDEINRGNISKIFGELITLIEGTKREGMDEAASAILPYSGESFSVPSNVYILGTMNTADRSIALMDTALRRRFSFIEMMPDADVLTSIGADIIEADGETLNVAAMLETINERIEFLFDREHTIGHAFFTGLATEPTIEKLASIFSKSVIPLLQEYFYEDYQKIQLVLGDNAKGSPDLKFIKDSKVDLKQIFVGNVEDIVDEKEVSYSINEEAFYNINAYKTIGRDL